MKGHSEIETTFCVIFTVELLLRILAVGKDFVYSGWGLFDLVIVLVMLLEQAIYMITRSDNALLNQMSVLRVLRVIRIVRVLRVIRMLQFFTHLRIMVLSIFASFRSLLWASLILLLIFYIFGISLTQGVTDYLESTDSWDAKDMELLVSKFGNLQNSILSLYKAMANGIS